jgi:hypothetical protein
MDELNLDNVLTEQDIENLFVDNPIDNPAEEKETAEEPDKETKKEEDDVVDVDNLFTTGNKQKEEPEDNTKDTLSTSSSSSTSSIFSSITQALVEEGVFSDLTEEVINGTNSAEAFKKLIEDKIQEGLDDTQKRINKALGYGLEPDTITQYENTLKQLDSVTEDFLSEETEQSENLRKSLIYQDCINRGYSKDRANREVQKSLNAGTDVEDAKEALVGNKDFFQKQYDTLMKDAEEASKKEQENIDKMAEGVKKSILEDKNIFGDYEIDKKTRQKIVDNISKPVYKDPKTGRTLTALQQYEVNNKAEFVKNLGIIFTITDGFKNLDGFVKGKVRKEVKKGLAELENTLNNTNRNSDGTLNFANGGDPESFLGKGWKFDF